MSKLYKINAKTALGILVVACLLILTFYVRAAGNHYRPLLSFAPVQDTVPSQTKKDSSSRFLKTSGNSDTSRNGKDSMVIKVDTIQMAPDSIDAVVKYHADDSGVLIVPTNEFFLYGKAKTDYKNLNIEAATIHYNHETSIISAYGATDSTGSIGSKPKFTQDDLNTISDSIAFNVKTGKALTKNTFLQEGEIYVNARYIKKINADESFARDARFTTCNLDTPHFAFRTRRMKIINNKLGVTGRVYPEIESIPIPMIFLPFGLFPLNPARHSGVLLPSFASSEDFGLGLEGLGYYKVFSDHVDATARANIYSYLGWTLNLNSKYIMRYKYTGNVNLTFQNTRMLNRNAFTKEEFTTFKSYMIDWSHSRDNRARPGTNFSANVHFGSTRFNQLVQNNPFVNFNNQLSSSINYSKDWRGKYNLSMNLNHTQNSVNHLVNLNLPTLNFNVTTLYPFQSKDQVGSGKWYEKIGVGYSGNFLNQLSFYDTAFNLKRLLDTAQWGAQHNIPITLSLPQLGSLTLSPSVSYEERWYGQKTHKDWNPVTKRVDTTTKKGFYTARQMSFGLGVNTRIFGTYKFSPKSSIIAIRHEVRPTFSISYHPDFAAKSYYTTQVDSFGRTVRLSQYEGGVVGAFSEGAFGGISFGIDNLLEMKVKDKNDTTLKGRTEGKKVKLIEGFGFNASYNLLADSFPLSNFSIYARSTLFEKVNITASANLDPYDVDKTGYRVNKIYFDPGHFKFGRITGGNIAMSTSFSSKPKDGKDDKTRELPVDPFMTPDEQQRQLQFARSNPGEFTDFNIPWTLSLSYSLNFNRVLLPDFSKYVTETFSGLSFNGDFSLTPKWKVGATGSYDVTNRSLQQLSTFITREMHCWQLSINVNPIGLYRSFNISFSPKSGILRDLKINRSRSFSSN
ncbi:MAG: putative LPS assembly protein LptD [Bacteroidota bacterium]